MRSNFSKYLYLFLGIVINIHNINAQLLWEISGNNLNHKSYLYGTIHIVPKEKFVVKPHVEQAFNASTHLIQEVDLNLSTREMIDMAQSMTLPKGTTLQGLLGDAEYQKLQTYCINQLKMKKKKFKKYSRLKPFFFSSLLLVEQLGKTEGYEKYFSSQASKAKMTESGLETMQQQMAVVETIALKDQAQMLVGSLGSEMTEFNRLLEKYLNEDLNSVQQLIEEETDDMGSFNENFLVKRNENWIPKLEAFMAKESCFIAVGAAHLPGERGVINLLKSKGYTVRPVLN
ncbi:MAG: TraB/GumN family protein [Bacteroidia bacterium]|jgi:uncharacterized protein YbaP (TraB family)